MRLGDTVLKQLFPGGAHAPGLAAASEVPDSLLKEVVDLMKMGPTSYNCLPARIVFVKSKAAKERLKPHLSAGNVDKTMAAPATRDHRPRPRNSTQHPPKGQDPLAVFEGKPELAQTAALRNGSLQGAYFMLAARALGLDIGAHVGLRQCRRRQGVLRRHGRQIELSVQCGLRRSGGAAPARSALCFRRDCADNLSSRPGAGQRHECTGVRYLPRRGVRGRALARRARANGCRATASSCARRGHAERLMPMIAEVMEEAGLAFGDLDAHRRDGRPRHLHRRARRRRRGAWPGAGVGRARRRRHQPRRHGASRRRAARAARRAAAGRGGRCPSRHGLPPALRRRAGSGEPAPAACARGGRSLWSARKPVTVVGSGAAAVADAIMAAGGEAEARLADSAAACPLAGAAGRRSRPRQPLAAALSAAARRQAASRQVPEPSGGPMSAHRLQARQHPLGRARACRGACQAARRAVRGTVGRRGLSQSAEPPRLDRLPGARRHAAADRRASSSASSPPTRPRSSPSACGKDSQRHGIGRRLVEALGPRRQEGRGAAAVSRGRGRQHPGARRSTRSSASRRSAGAKATTSGPARRPRMR